jgi:tripartite-type tricarboxylate transporter receptor subunit TctC
MFARPVRWRAGLAVTAAALGTCLTAAPTPAADFYAGKTVEFLIGGDVGGGYDIYARTLARHLHRFIPGSPTIVTKNQPGAGSGRAASFLYGVAPKDGSAIGAVFPGAIMGPLLDDRAQALYDPTKFQYLGSADNATRVCISHERSQIKSFEDTLRHKAIMGASAAGGSTRDYVNMHKKTTGAMFDLVAGYKGTADIFLAMERGEVDGMCGLDWASLKSQRPDWVRNKTANILGQQVFGRPYLAPPGVAAEPLKILRDAFSATMADKEFLADAERTRIDVVPSSGERVQQLVEQLYATPKATIERAKDLIKP